MNKTVDRSARVLSIVDTAIIKDMAIIMEVEQIDKVRAESNPTLSEELVAEFKERKGFDSIYFNLFSKLRRDTGSITLGRNFDSMRRFNVKFQEVMNALSKDYKGIAGEPLVRYLKGELVHIIKKIHNGQYNNSHRPLDDMIRDMTTIINAVCYSLLNKDLGPEYSSFTMNEIFIKRASTMQRCIISELIGLMSTNDKWLPLYTGIPEIDELLASGMKPGTFTVFGGSGISLGALTIAGNTGYFDLETNYSEVPTGFGKTLKCNISGGIPFKLVDGESAGGDDLMNVIRSREALITKELGVPQEFLLNSEALENISKEPILRHIQQPVRHPLEIKTDGYCNDKDRTKNHFEKFIGGKGYVTKSKNKR